MSVEENQEPLPAIIRVRRKRTAPPSSGWMVSAKKNKVDENNKNLERPAIFKLAVTAADPSISNVSDLILPEKVAVVDYDREKGIIKQHGIIDEQQDQINTAAEMVEKMDVSDVPGPSSNKNKAPLASNESLDVVEALDLSCKYLQGRKVDWFVAYKLPDGISGLRNSGKSFIYFDSRSSSWIPSAKKIDDPDSAIGKTLGQLWEVKRDSELLYAVYNDDHPDKGNKSLSDSFRAHMKGALAFDDFTGFWMSYSVPNFVDLSKRKYSFPDTGTKYGQTFMCLTLSVTQLKEIGDYLYFSQPSINLDNALSEKRFTTKNGPLSSFEFIETLAGTKIAAFSKNKKIQKDIYKDLIGPNLQVPLAVESWLLGSAKNLPSSCGSNTVLNIKEVTLNVNGKPYIFQSSKDHSKWAISGNSNKPIVCIGDNNRQESQLGRGGGALCISNKQLWSQFRNSIAKLECCGGREASSC